MLAVLFWLGIIGYAVAWAGAARIGKGTGPSVLEVLSSSFTGTLPRPGEVATAPGESFAPTAPSQEKVQAFTRDAMAAVPGVSNSGIFSCRKVNNRTDPGAPWSEHAWGLAVDLSGSRPTLDKVAAFACRNKGKYGIRNVLWNGASGGCASKAAGHDTHVHVGWGRPSGTPPCAQGRTG